MQALSGGRLTLGLAVGARIDDYDAAGVDAPGPRRRGSPSSSRTLRRLGRRPVGRRRATRRGSSSAAWLGRRLLAHGALRRRLRAQRRAAARVRPRRGQRARRVERPRPPGRARALGAGLLRARRRGPRATRTCATTTPSPARSPSKIAAGNLTSARAMRDFVRGYEEAGCDELVLFPTVADIGQLERLAEALA